MVTTSKTSKLFNGQKKILQNWSQQQTILKNLSKKASLPPQHLLSKKVVKQMCNMCVVCFLSVQLWFQEKTHKTQTD